MSIHSQFKCFRNVFISIIIRKIKKKKIISFQFVTQLMYVQTWTYPKAIASLQTLLFRHQHATLCQCFSIFLSPLYPLMHSLHNPFWNRCFWKIIIFCSNFIYFCFFFFFAPNYPVKSNAIYFDSIWKTHKNALSSITAHWTYYLKRAKGKKISGWKKKKLKLKRKRNTHEIYFFCSFVRSFVCFTFTSSLSSYVEWTECS